MQIRSGFRGWSWWTLLVLSAAGAGGCVDVDAVEDDDTSEVDGDRQGEWIEPCDLVIVEFDGALVSPKPGYSLCPVCAQVVASGAHSVDVAIRLGSNHGFSALVIDLHQVDIAPLVIDLASTTDPVHAMWRLSSWNVIHTTGGLTVVGLRAANNGTNPLSMQL